MKLRNLVISILVCLSAGLIGSVFTFPSIPTWYAALIKPPFSPPNWIFGPVWTTLYILMAIAMYMVWQKGLKKKNIRQAIHLFLIHLTVNAGWSIVFFGLHSILGGMVVIFILWGFIVYLTNEFYRIDRTAGYLLIPYIFWVSFASILNFSLLVLNQ
jgi:tryptophan-rich sensory protein